MNCWSWVNRLANEAGVPLIVFAPIGTSFTGHVAALSRQTGVYVVSSLEWPAVEEGLRMVRAKRMFEETRVLWIQGSDRNETVLERLGTKVRAIPRNTFNELFDKMPVNEEVKDVASTFRKHAKRVVEPTWQDSLNSARVYTTAKRLMTDEQANAISMDCLGMVSAKLMPTPPCGAWTMFQDMGVTCGCEADLFGAISLMLTSYLLDRPGYMNDPVAETVKNLLWSPPIAFPARDRMVLTRSRPRTSCAAIPSPGWESRCKSSGRSAPRCRSSASRTLTSLSLIPARWSATLTPRPPAVAAPRSRSRWTTSKTAATCSVSTRWSRWATIGASWKASANSTASRSSIPRNTPRARKAA